jgi:hypothetical protein
VVDTASVLQTDSPMLRLISALGDAEVVGRGAGVVELRIPLA